jgi:methylated-DNA-[protein]-cysteine S-methyltransferase
MTVAIGSLDTPIGPMMLACTEEGVCGVGWGSGPRTRARLVGRRRVVDDPARTETALAQLTEYFAGERRDFDLAVDWCLTGGPQREVLEALHAKIHYGKVITYGGLSGLSPTEIPARGIGTIMGSNPIPIVVPCHRVVAGDGLGGYSGGSGIEVKRWLLTLEGAIPATLDWSITSGPAFSSPHPSRPD